MFQTFEVSSQPKQGPPRLKALRAVMAQQGFAAWLTPRADAHQGEYVADCDARLSWLTGFTGSAGFAVCLQDQAGVFVDGRYRVQVRSEVDTDVFTPVDWPETSLSDWLIGALPEGGKVGFDPWLHTITQMQELRKAFANGALEMTASD
ncbi:MAG: aminopeptidase P family N-terminal domain-containing protein, partial [Rhodobacteraceae bacterium]|nr:aminopeptidase P family N-terminal domain-containing protein [Paracoccaceae bacterium]